MKNLAKWLACLSIFVAASSCLKTRAQLKEDSDDAAKPVPNAVTDVQPQGQYVIDEVKNEMTRMNGRIEDIERTQKADTSGQAAAAMKEEMKKLETRMTELEQAQANIIEQLKKTQETAAAANADPNEVFDKAMSQMDSGNWDGAAQSFNAYFKTKGKKVEDATFYRGECYYNLKQYKQAIVDYSKFPEKFTKSPHLPEALFKIGQSFEALGMNDDAKGFYQDLVDKFPKSKQAKKVKSKIK